MHQILGNEMQKNISRFIKKTDSIKPGIYQKRAAKTNQFTVLVINQVFLILMRPWSSAEKLSLKIELFYFSLTHLIFFSLHYC